MSSRPELNAHKFFADRFAAVLAQQGNSPRQVSSMGFGALAITDGSPSAAAASAAVPSAPASPAAVTTPLSSGQQEVRPAPVGPLQASGQSATVVEIDDDDEEMDGDEEVVGVRRGEETGVLVDDGETGGADDDDEMGEVDEDEEILSVDLGDPALFEDRETWVSELEKLSPVRDNEGSPEFRVRLQTSFGKKRVAYREKMDTLAEIKAEKRRRSPSAHDEVTWTISERLRNSLRFDANHSIDDSYRFTFITRTDIILYNDIVVLTTVCSDVIYTQSDSKNTYSFLIIPYNIDPFILLSSSPNYHNLDT
ncbi:hypothetical protein TREMEDRAFT_66445 [Tremella mesenterica DSM 1558]|uniref:uncharacterized protein n=1 Tax=Tremella mesenterica (strain ATCC 24925 / CBS 8224 / DSM 1558 / NBRC 9311 / NRRL Y-6157 / RJB 2259-6 / UBC 559-6) TaxID=578456 RepID=UPI00032D454C|nr:uncharacterized protein TREMEDRAFT_66445 [Tremella mesenterica DSM 1558]EIW65534.1 hypothetical protein TREMEDRAFT_66445 [Tremella mesenterica DSM 1558]